MLKRKKWRKVLASAAIASFLAGASVPATVNAAYFKDVPDTNSHAQAINELTEAKFISGYGDGAFRPHQSITRGQVTKILSRFFPGERHLKQVFSDVPANHPDAELVRAAYEIYENQVMEGANGDLMPYSPITRQQLAKILVQRLSLEHVEGRQSRITDLGKAYPEYRDYIAILSENGITNVTKFRPTEPVTRAQFASFMNRSLAGFKTE